MASNEGYLGGGKLAPRRSTSPSELMMILHLKIMRFSMTDDHLMTPHTPIKGMPKLFLVLIFPNKLTGSQVVII